MVAAVDGDRGQQPVGIGAAGAVAVCAQGGVRRHGQAFGRIERALQPGHFCLDQLQARLRDRQGMGRQLGLGQQGRRFGRMVQRLCAVALA
ncbi:hypothetical protein D3C81_1316730 [compost metagenome]